MRAINIGRGALAALARNPRRAGQALKYLRRYGLQATWRRLVNVIAPSPTFSLPTMPPQAASPGAPPPSAGMLSAIDRPTSYRLDRITPISGWCFALSGSRLRSVTVAMNGRPVQALQVTPRADLQAAYPQHPSAAYAGFSGDLVLADGITAGSSIAVDVSAAFADGARTSVLSRTFTVGAPAPPTPPARMRSYSLDDILEDPDTGKRDGVLAWLGAQDPMQAGRRILEGVPHFHAPGVVPLLRVSDEGPTHPYGERSLALIKALPAGGLFLDLGSGIKAPEHTYPNAVYLDAVHFRTVDVVNTCPRLPFRDGVFDLVVSQAVFEHLPDPFAMAREIFRILKPGGKVLIDTAFMQPLHADPDHYFNMSLEGLRLVLAGFEILEDGIQPYQMPSYGLRMQIDAVLPFMASGPWKDRLEGLLKDLAATGGDLDRDLGPIGQAAMAAGVFAIARRPNQA